MLNEDYILATDVMILVQFRLVSRYLGINCLLHSNGFPLFIVDIFLVRKEGLDILFPSCANLFCFSFFLLSKSWRYSLHIATSLANKKNSPKRPHRLSDLRK